MNANRPNHPRSRRRRLILIATAITVSASVIICGGAISILALYRFNDDQQRTPQGAIVEYFDAIQFQDKTRLKAVLCPNEDADKHINQLQDRLNEANFKLQSLSWIPAESIPDSGSSHTVNGTADVSATRVDKNFDVRIGYRVTVKKKFLSWYVCKAEQTT